MFMTVLYFSLLCLDYFTIIVLADTRVVIPTCVLQDNCANADGGINPRTGGICPEGQVECAEEEITCGLRHVSNYNTNSGVSTMGAHPWLAYIIDGGNFLGSGTLLDTRHILTAAHKVFAANPSSLRVYLGVFNPNNLNQAQSFSVDVIATHNYFNNETFKNNIALLRLSTSVNFNAMVGSACLPTANQMFTDQICIVAGWGESSFGANDASTGTLRQVNVLIVDYYACKTSMDQQRLDTAKYLDPFGEICAGGQPNYDACTQDGGAPLICLDSSTNRYTIIGIVIWGKGCGMSGVYGVYTNVPYYRNWIDNILQQI